MTLITIKNIISRQEIRKTFSWHHGSHVNALCMLNLHCMIVFTNKSGFKLDNKNNTKTLTWCWENFSFGCFWINELVLLDKSRSQDLENCLKEISPVVFFSKFYANNSEEPSSEERLKAVSHTVTNAASNTLYRNQSLKDCLKITSIYTLWIHLP